ncbi:MAG: NAD-dependent epimerase/dehydratase family protein [Proteobacteria bacterium]|nr:NAD-dependent epimerase/dehydratase family protein [Pseudomonadota bacterium]
MSIIITGGCGLIGANLARIMVEKGREVVTFDVTPAKALPADLASKVTHVQGDITNFSEVLNAFRDHGVKEVFHLAATLSAPSEANPWRAYKINNEGTYHALEAARICGVGKFLFSSSMGSYGMGHDGHISDETIQQPTIIYGVTKVFGELLGRYYQRKFGIDFRGVRLPQIVGPGVTAGGFGQYNPGMIEAAAQGRPYEVWVPEDTVLPLMYISDGIRSLAELYEADAAAIKTRIYNLGQITPSPTAAELAEIVTGFFPQAQISFKPDPQAVEVLQYIPSYIDGSNAAKEWGWKLAGTAQDMVRDFIADMKAMEQN